MSNLETYYLIDFENVHEEGLSGSDKLGAHDHIHIFSTENAPKISFKELALLNFTEHFSHIIPSGRQSLDMHLVAYLGYLIGLNNNNCRYIIVSKDTDFDNIISFIKKEISTNISITRQTKIDSSSSKNSIQKPVVSKSYNSMNHNNEAEIISQQKTNLNTEIQRSVSNAGYSGSTVNKVASIVVKHYGEDKFANNVHNELRQIYSDYSDVYKNIKPILSRYSSSTNQYGGTTDQYKNEIKKILNKANFSNDIISYIILLITNHSDEENAKDTIYRAIINRYGQGLNIYNHIKNHIK